MQNIKVVKYNKRKAINTIDRITLNAVQNIESDKALVHALTAEQLGSALTEACVKIYYLSTTLPLAIISTCSTAIRLAPFQ